MIYNFNLGIGWASSGVEYAQIYRARMFRNIGAEARFIFTDMISQDNIQILTENIGFWDEEVIWLYSFFTDNKVSPLTYTLQELEKTFQDEEYTFEREGKKARYTFKGQGNFYTCYMQDEESDLVHRVEIVSGGCLIRKDFFNHCKLFSEYYAPLENAAHLYARRFFNENGSLAYEEIIDGEDRVMYRFPDRILFSKEELVGYMVERLKLTQDDVMIIDRTTGVGQSILQNVGKARVGIVVHADHFSEGSTDEQYILWNNYYEYAFAQHKHISFYVCATEAQSELIRQQFSHYVGTVPNVITIPVGSLASLHYPEKPRKKHALITASRLATEKHVDWLVEAVVKVHEVVPDVTLDIYGKGGEEEKLHKLIDKLQCRDYVKLCGQQKLDEVYQNYEAYFAGSTSEGFGLTLLEAVGGGLPIVGFDVRYGNQTFIDDGQNGYKLPINDKMEQREKIQLLADAMTRLLTQDDLEACHKHSYEIASRYLTSEIEKKWKEVVG
ncbi:MAG: accessory Sec system glycosyltransferase GtfA [Lachnospiraceae bacterium]|nr:accessory Sec system glycosyltransferase GtfA [Lachnospiraceae bacterium]